MILTGQEDAKNWKSEMKEVWPYATSVTTTLFFTSTLTAWFVTWMAGPNSLFSYVLAAVDPAVAAVTMILVCLLRPAVFSGRQFALPHTVALPTVYMAVIYSMKLLGRDAATVQRYEEIERFDLIWLNPWIVLIVWIGMIIVLTLIGTFKSKSSGE